MAEHEQDETLQQLGKFLGFAVDVITGFFPEGSPIKVSILMRMEDDPLANSLAGNDKIDDIIRALESLRDSQAEVRNMVITPDGGVERVQ